ncbi:AAA family ATPase [Rhizobium helianthi]|uniref:AAA family ATPase n=1 Tax=Rhizobium helianthi TaxID=1132695 RepID=A0ABW4M5A4_9HYPH
MNRLIIISGCSGGGKSSLLLELSQRGYTIVEEPGRRIVSQELARQSTALPWIDLAAFARRAIRQSLEDLSRTKGLDGDVFFDRGLIDAANALCQSSAPDAEKREAQELCSLHRFHRTVFMTPPWPEIYHTDAERNHDLVTAVKEYESLRGFYPKLGYEPVALPRISIAQRADFVLTYLRANC